jgi:hypothetical protein
VTITQLDDIGTLNVVITTTDGMTTSGNNIYTVPTPDVYDLSQFSTTPTKPLSTFLKVTDDPFQYSIYKDSSDLTTLLWSSNPDQLYFSDYFVMDAGTFTMNPNIN